MHRTALPLGTRVVRASGWAFRSIKTIDLEAVLTMLRAELEMVMRQAGTVRIDAIDRSYLATPDSER